MPRNASGVYSLPEVPFVAGTTIESDPMNNDLSDIADALTDSLATTGVTSMTGPVKAASGSVTAPSYTFSAALGTGFWLSDSDEISWSAGGVLMGVFGATGVVSFVALALSGDLLVTGSAGFAADVGITGDLGVIGQIFVGNGSASNPSYSFLNSDGAGLYLSATNQLGVAVASVNVATIRASGSVAFVGDVTVSGDLGVVGVLTVTGSIISSSPLPGAIVGIIKDVKTTSSNGQALGTNTIRNLNTLEYNRDSIVALTTASSTFSLQPGSYYVDWIAPTFYNNGVTNTTHSFLVRSTTSATIATSIPTGSGTNDDGSTDFTHGKTVLVAEATASFHLYHHSDNGSVEGGKANGVVSSVYTTIVIFAA